MRAGGTPGSARPLRDKGSVEPGGVSPGTGFGPNNDAQQRKGGDMPYARVGIWQLGQGGDRAELTKFIQSTILPDLQKQSGFISYVAVSSGDEYAVGVQTWETQEQAATAGARSGDQIRQQIGQQATLESWFHGQVAIDIPHQPLDKARYARIGVWDIAPGANRQELTEKARESLIPMIQQVTGLVSYQAIESVEGRLVVVHTWQSLEDSERGMQSTGQWLQETLANQLALVARYDGNVVLASGGKSGSASPQSA